MKLWKIGALLVAATSAAFAAAGIGVGDKAPALKVAKWAKGKPIAKLEPGKVYVVEFWATWCGPCKTSIPHLTELAQKFKDKVTFTGVSVWENQPGSKDTAYFKTVDAFVKDMGRKMEYNVAVDDVDGTMAKTWMTAAGQDGIPAAFVIDQTGTIAWIGHPMSNLEEVLEKVVAGTYDIKAEKARFAEEAKMKAERSKMQEELSKSMGEIMEMVQAGKFKEALPKLDDVIAKNPMVGNELLGFKFNLLLENDEPAAYTFAKAAGEKEWKDNSMMLNQIAWTIIEGKPPVTKPDLDVAIAMAERAVQLTKSDDPMILDTLAFGVYKKGDKARAIELQTKAVSLLDSKKDIPDDIKKEIRDRLEQFKKGG